MIKIICLGKIKEPYLIEGIKDYSKRIKKYTHLEIIELKEESSLVTTKNLGNEKERIMANIKDNDFVITLQIDGQLLTSVELAKLIDQTLIHNPNIVFIIGSSEGLANEVKQRANYRLSFSQLTFPHQLFRLILLEQIYRSYKITNNERYHK